MKSLVYFRTSRLFAILCGIFIILYIITRITEVDPQTYHSSLVYNIGIASYKGGRIVIFNDSNLGPFTGGTMRIGRYHDPTSTKPEMGGFGEQFGLYYRAISSEDSRTAWTLMISLWYPIVIFGILAFILKAWGCRLHKNFSHAETVQK